jgi:hypothetical protein
MNDRRGAYRVLVWRHVRKRTLGRPKLRWEIIMKCMYGKLDGRHGID